MYSFYFIAYLERTSKVGNNDKKHTKCAATAKWTRLKHLTAM